MERRCSEDWQMWIRGSIRVYGKSSRWIGAVRDETKQIVRRQREFGAYCVDTRWLPGGVAADTGGSEMRCRDSFVKWWSEDDANRENAQQEKQEAVRSKALRVW